ncbi:MAG: UDP-glucose 4-epimerase, partial [Clostridia bacterium]|nr:UDP-glucose 4-epimerase [Clostridia bacterium]
EKMYETLLTKEESARTIDMGNYYRTPCDMRDLNYDKRTGGELCTSCKEFNSNNTRILTLEETISKIASLEYVQNELRKMKI